MFEKII